MFSLSQLKKLKQVYNKIVAFADEKNITAIIPELERFGAMVSLYDTKNGEEIYALKDSALNRLSKIENRTTAEFNKFKYNITRLFAFVIDGYLYKNDSKYNRVIKDATIIGNYAAQHNPLAFTFAEQYSKSLKAYSFKHGSDFLYYASGYSEDASGYKKLDQLATEYGGKVLKIAQLEFMDKL